MTKSGKAFGLGIMGAFFGAYLIGRIFPFEEVASISDLFIKFSITIILAFIWGFGTLHYVDKFKAEESRANDE